MRMLDLFCGRWGWSKAFAKRGWECMGIDLVAPPDDSNGCLFMQADILNIAPGQRRGTLWIKHLGDFFDPDFICASPPCEQFSVHGMKHFHPNPPYPELGIKLFEHARRICIESGVPFVIENVRAAQQFVGNADCHDGPFYLWHNFGHFPLQFGRPFKLPRPKSGKGTVFCKPREFRKLHDPYYLTGSNRKSRDDLQAKVATIPPELANCVADYAERLCEQQKAVHESSGLPT